MAYSTDKSTSPIKLKLTFARCLLHYETWFAFHAALRPLAYTSLASHVAFHTLERTWGVVTELAGLTGWMVLVTLVYICIQKINQTNLTHEATFADTLWGNQLQYRLGALYL